jgi:hypothetical protein
LPTEVILITSESSVSDTGVIQPANTNEEQTDGLLTQNHQQIQTQRTRVREGMLNQAERMVKRREADQKSTCRIHLVG